jgi:hypothetical protein
MTIRLTKQIREETIRKAVIAKFGKTEAQLRSSLKAYASLFIPLVYPRKVRDWVDQAPLGGLDTKSIISFKELHKNGKDLVAVSSQNVELFNVLACDRYSRISVTVSKDESFKLKTLSSAVNDLEKQRTDFKLLVTGAIYACTTSKQLHKHYPDISKYLSTPEKEGKQLAVTSKQITDAFEEKVPKET